MLLPVFLLIVGLLLSAVFYEQYMNRISSRWGDFGFVEVSEIDKEGIVGAISDRTGEGVLTREEASALAETLVRWVRAQDIGTVEAFRAFREYGIVGTDVVVSEALGFYYAQFLNGYECANSGEDLAKGQRGRDIVDVLYDAHVKEHELIYNGKRLCLSCVERVSLSSLEIQVGDKVARPLNELMNGEDRLSLESFTGVFEAVGDFRHYLTGLVARSKTANVSFLMGSGEANRNAYKCGMQLLWLPKKQAWFPIELMIGYPGERMPMEAFLF